MYATISFWMETHAWIDQLHSNFNKLYIYITHHSEKTHIDFGIKMSKAKITGEHCLQIVFRMITPVKSNELFLKPY